MSMDRGLFVLMAVTAVLAGGLLLVVPSAAPSGSKCNPGCEAQAEFWSRGEILVVHDYDADGYSAVAYVQYKKGGSWRDVPSPTIDDRFWNSRGRSATVKVFNLSIKDGRRVRYLACKGERAALSVHDCSRNWHYDRA
jgi:hypothetical protein